MTQKLLSNLMEKEVTRKQFLSMLGLGVVGLTGFSTVLDMMTHHGSNIPTHGYGYRTYGGNAAEAQANAIKDAAATQKS